MTRHRKLLFATSLAAALTVVGCGGGNDGDDEPAAVTTTVPGSASASTASLLSFIMGLSDSDETTEPLSISDTFTVPPNESGEPTPMS